MLHLAVIAHGPDTCAAVEEELKEVAEIGLRDLPAAAGELGAKDQPALVVDKTNLTGSNPDAKVTPSGEKATLLAKAVVSM